MSRGRFSSLSVSLSSLDGVVEYHGVDADGVPCDGLFIPYERNEIGRDERGERVLCLSAFRTPVRGRYDLCRADSSGDSTIYLGSMRVF